MRKIVDVERPTIAQRRFDVAYMGKLLEDAYLKGRREAHDRPKTNFAPSGIGYGAGACPRRWFYDFKGGLLREDDTDAVGIANMAYGTEAHERIQDLFKQAGILIEAEREIDTRDQEGVPPVRGFVDLVIDWQGEEAVGEIKTTMQESFVSKRSKNQPAGYHLLQVLIYMKALDIHKGFILYENKNLQNMLIIPVVWSEANKKLVEDTWQWMLDVHNNWKEDKLPERPYRSIKSKACKTCPFKTHCWEDEAGVVKLPVLEVPA